MSQVIREMQELLTAAVSLVAEHRLWVSRIQQVWDVGTTVVARGL